MASGGTAQPRTLNMPPDGQRALAGPQQQRVLRRDGELLAQRRQIAGPPVHLREAIQGARLSGVRRRRSSARAVQVSMARERAWHHSARAPRAGLEGGRRA